MSAISNHPPHITFNNLPKRLPQKSFSASTYKPQGFSARGSVHPWVRELTQVSSDIQRPICHTLRRKRERERPWQPFHVSLCVFMRVMTVHLHHLCEVWCHYWNSLADSKQISQHCKQYILICPPDYHKVWRYSSIKPWKSAEESYFYGITGLRPSERPFTGSSTMALHTHCLTLSTWHRDPPYRWLTCWRPYRLLGWYIRADWRVLWGTMLVKIWTLFDWLHLFLGGQAVICTLLEKTVISQS